MTEVRITNEAMRHMKSETAITDTIFSAFLQCETKAYLLREGENGTRRDVSNWQWDLAGKYRQSALEPLKSSVRGTECYTGTPSQRMVEQCRYKLIVDPVIASPDVRTRPDALWRIHSNSDVSNVLYIPLRLVWREKLSINDKLLLAFDALAISRVTGKMPRSGKIIHGAQYAAITVPLAKLLERARSTLTKITNQQANTTPPELVLNRHCPECQFHPICRQVAVEKDDLSLLANMTAKEREKQNRRGIFTVNHLSYAFRPRRRKSQKNSRAPKHESALKALAIRKGLIHVVGSPSFVVPESAVYLDVEGVPDRDFYYLIGLRCGGGDKVIQHSFWADSASDEPTMWAACMRVLKFINNPCLIHYGSYETRFLKRMKARYVDDAGDKAFLEKLISSSFNLLSLTYSQIYFPTYTNGLKDIARYLGFEWSERDASGLNTLVWRSEWEVNRNSALKQRLLKYNLEDCEAAKKVAEAIADICSKQPSMGPKALSVNVNTLERESPLRFGSLQYAVPDFKAINEAAYWDYLRTKVYVRSSDRLKRISQTGRKRQSTKVPPVNKSIQTTTNRPKLCPNCNSTKLYRNGRFSHVIYDLRFSPAGIRRWVVRHCFYRYHCRNCAHGYNELPHQEKFGQGLKAYILYQIIELRVSQHAVARSLGTLFGLQISSSTINRIKARAAIQYEVTYRSILQRIVDGPLAHADETRVTINGESRYVWVFTNLEDVAYVYSESRDASTAREVLSGFGGVLVTDFYSGYDSIDCAQQRCLIHLLRDINDDVWKEPFNKEMEELALAFAHVLRPIVETIDRYGLKARYLRKHRLAVARFYRALSKRDYRTKVAVGYQKRFEKNHDKLFTFLEHDGVPWNNNNAEHAIKAFARLRNDIGAKSTPKGIQEYSVLLSISETCNYKGISFLHFLRSGEVDIEGFGARP